MDLVADIAAAITHLFYPHICLGCGSDKIGQDSSLCWYCLHDLPINKIIPPKRSFGGV